MAAQHRFFHWGLTFPEVFFSPDGTPKADGGFDAVIGNPPYVRQERIQPIKPYLEANYQVYSGTADLYLYFYERALQLLKPGQRVGYITSGTFMNSNSAVGFRQYLKEQAAIEHAVNFGENQPFKGAEMVYPTIAILKKGKPAPTFKSVFIADVYRRDQLGEAIASLPTDDVSVDALALPEWRFQSVALTHLFQKVTDGKQTLEDYVNGQMYRGIVTGFNEAFVIDTATRDRLIAEHPSSAEIIKPMLRGQDLRPWYQIKSGEYVVFTRQGIDIEAYPAIKNYLSGFRQALEPKPEDWAGEWEGRKSGSYKWYEIQDNVAYFAKFEKPKLMWPDIGKLPRFSHDTNGYYNNDKGFIIASSAYSLLANLNSRVAWFALSQTATPLRLRGGLWQYQAKLQFVERLPIPALTAAQESSLGALAEEITALAGSRYRLHESARHRIGADLGQGGKLNEALQAWWDLPDLTAFREQVNRAFRADVPLRERDEWEGWLTDQQAQHRALTDQIIDRETHLNAVVYQAFDLTADEIALVERATKYPYGAV